MKVLSNQEIHFLFPPLLLTLTKMFLESHLGILDEVFKFSTVQSSFSAQIIPAQKWVCVLENLGNLGLKEEKIEIQPAQLSEPYL